MRIYIAAPYPLREEAIALKHYLEHHGHIVTSRWLVEERAPGDTAARGDLEDVRSAELLLALHPEDWHERGTGGRHVEFGYALALKKQLVIVGKRTNNFHHLSHVRVIETIQDL